MSTEENKEIQRRIVEEVFNKHNLELADELIDTNFVHRELGGEEYKGVENFKQNMTVLFSAFPDVRLAIDDMVAEGDKVASRMTARGTHQGAFMGIAPTGKKVEFTGIVIGRFAGGKQVETWRLLDNLGVIQQLGVIPPSQ